MSWRLLNRIRRKYKISCFNITWFFIIFLMVCWLYKLLPESEKTNKQRSYDYHLVILDNKSLNDEIDRRLNSLQSERLAIRENMDVINGYEKRLVSVESSTNLISSYIALFAVLITVISIFFSLRESNRIDSLVEKYEDEVERYKKLRGKYQKELQELDGKINASIEKQFKGLNAQINKVVMDKLKEIQSGDNEYITPSSFTPPRSNQNNNPYKHIRKKKYRK